MVDMEAMVETVVVTVEVVVGRGPNTNTSILQSMEHESMYCYKTRYNEVQVEVKVVVKVVGWVVAL